MLLPRITLPFRFPAFLVTTSAVLVLSVGQPTLAQDSGLKQGDSTTGIQHSDRSQYRKTRVLATIGQGEITTADGSENNRQLNRDSQNTGKAIVEIDRQQGNIDLTVDNRLLTKDGRKQIREDIKRTELLAKSVADVATSSVSLTGDQAAGETSLLKNIDNKQQLFDATKAFATTQQNAAHLSTLQDPNATPEQKQAAYTTFVNHVAEHLGVPPTEARLMVDTHYKGSYDRSNGTIYINDRAQASASDAINTLGHEVSHHVDNVQDGEAAATKTRQYHDNREEYVDNIGDTTEELVSFQFSNNNVGQLATQNTSRNTATSAAVAENTKAHQPLPAETTERALCEGICVGAVIGTALYVLDKGEGDPVEGIEKIGAGDHPVGDVIDIVTEEAIKISYAHFPAETAQVLTQAARLGEAVNTVVEYVDDSTGNVVSRQWHQLDKATQHRLIGAGKIVSVVVPAVKVATVTKVKSPKTGQFASNAVLNKADSVYHSPANPNSVSKTQNILGGVNPDLLNTNSRFGKAFYVGDNATTVTKELSHHGLDSTYAIRYKINPDKAKVLDFTNPKIAKEWGYLGGKISSDTKALGDKAKASGYNVIKFNSERNSGSVNHAILDDFDSILKPETVVPVKP